MNEENLKLAAKIIDANYVDLASQSLTSRENMIKNLLAQRSVPEEGWDDLTIEYLMNNLALMDTNNFHKKSGIGERESRIYSSIVSKRNFYMGHGIGRSGDIKAIQPKASGSSLIAKLAHELTFDMLKIAGYQFVEDLIVLPLATGMAITTVFLTLKEKKPDAKYVVWCRIDQKTCLKCIKSANLEPLAIDGIVSGDEITTNLEMIEETIKKYTPEKILAVLSTTSCFGPRVPDKVEEISKICSKYNVAHVINNAYGVQCSKIAFAINQSIKHGRVDAVVQSTDKNFMVPVGGSIIYSPNNAMIKGISELYPGRASAAPLVDLFITYLSMGKKGYAALLKERKENLVYFKQKLSDLAKEHNESVLNTPNNTISIVLTLKHVREYMLDEEIKKESKLKKDTFLGSLLYSKRVMGSRVISVSKEKEVCGLKFKNYGSHIDEYANLPYMTAACAIGLKKEEIDWFIARLDEALKELKKMYLKQTANKLKPTEELSMKVENAGQDAKDNKPEEQKKDDNLPSDK